MPENYTAEIDSLLQKDRSQKRSQEIIDLFGNPGWLVRKQLVHDFSHAARGEYKQKSTLDIDTRIIKNILSRGNGGPVGIPLEWRPKGLIMSLDASFNGTNCHILSRHICQSASVALLKLEAHDEIGQFPDSIQQLIKTLAFFSPREIQTNNLNRDTIKYFLKESQYIKQLLKRFHEKFDHKRCPDNCSGNLELWETLCKNDKFLHSAAAFTLGYIRAAEILLPAEEGVGLLKTEEVAAENPFEQIRNARPDALWLQADPANLVIRRTVNVILPANVNNIKCLPPEQAQFVETPEGETIPFKASHPPTDLTPTEVRMDVAQEGAWAHKKQGNKDGLSKGSGLEIRMGLVDVVSNRASLIFPGLILTSLGLLAHLYMLGILIFGIKRFYPGNMGSSDIASTLIGALAVIVPLLILAYVSTSRHVLLIRLLEPYRTVLIWGTLLQLVAIGTAIIFERASFGFLSYGLTVSIILFLIFLDATWQKSDVYFTKRLARIRKLRGDEGWRPLSIAILLSGGALNLLIIVTGAPLYWVLVAWAARMTLWSFWGFYLYRSISSKSMRINMNSLLVYLIAESICFVATMSPISPREANPAWTMLVAVMQFLSVVTALIGWYRCSYGFHRRLCSTCKSNPMKCTTQTGSRLVKNQRLWEQGYKFLCPIDIEQPDRKSGDQPSSRESHAEDSNTTASSEESSSISTDSSANEPASQG